MGLKKRLRKLFGKSEKKDENQQPLSRNDIYGSDGKGLEFKINPNYEKNSETEATNSLYKDELEKPELEAHGSTEPEETLTAKDTPTAEETSTPIAEEVPAAEEIAPMVNNLRIIAGMPSKKSIEKMSGGLKLWKAKIYRDFAEPLNALENYQKIMQEPRAVTMNLVKARHTTRFTTVGADLNINGAAVKDAFGELRQFILLAEKAVDGEEGFFARRSSSVQKLKPIFANLLVQAYALLPKLANLQYEISPYVMATDKEKFTYEEVLNHEVSAGRSGGLAMRSAQEDSGAVVLNPKEALEALQGEDAEASIANLRKEKTQEKRMSLQIPPLPVGFFKSQDSKQDAKTRKAQADALTDSYLTEIRLLMRALDDTAESHEGGSEERLGVHNKQAEHFRMSKLLSHVLANRELLKDVIVNGMPKELTAEHKEIAKLCSMEEMTLSEGVAKLNAEAQDSSKFARLIDVEGKDLQEGTDYKIDGGKTSISILDFKNGRVLRTPKNLEKEQQNTALNGIYDEAVGKISQFLGLNVSAQAEAVGFKGKEKDTAEEYDAFGGSIMELVKGEEAKKLDFHMDGGKLNVSSEKDGNSIDDKKLGHLLGDMMKMHALDYIVMHGDRNLGNFMINLEAGEEDPMIQAIDNDRIFGSEGVWSTGHDCSSEALLSINDRVQQDFGSKVKSVFPMMTQEIKDLIERIDLQAFNEMLMPYADRVSRMAAVHRAGELKKWAKSVPTCDLSTAEGIQEFVKVEISSSMKEWAKQMYVDSSNQMDGMTRKFMSSTLLRLLSFNNKSTMWGSPSEVIDAAKSFGLSKEEITKILAENVSTSADKDEAIGMEGLMKSEFGELLKQYDAPQAS